jgi:hypothetical protein
MRGPVKAKRNTNALQHYVPQLLLRGFASRRSLLYVFDKRSGRSFRSSVQRAGCERGFYEHSGSRSSVDEWMKQAETQAGAIIVNICSRMDIGHLSQTNREWLAAFTARVCQVPQIVSRTAISLHTMRMKSICMCVHHLTRSCSIAPRSASRRWPPACPSCRRRSDRFGCRGTTCDKAVFITFLSGTHAFYAACAKRSAAAASIEVVMPNVAMIS